MKYYLLFFCLFFLLPLGLNAQKRRSQLPADTTALEQPGADTLTVLKAYFSNRPKKAMIYSLALPGAGQVYNKRWWKVPLVYGALGGMYAVVDFNQDLYRRFRTALDLKRAGKEHEFSGTRIDTERSLLSLRNSYDKNTQVSYFAFILVYTLQALEAFVDAHLKEFNIDDDLSFQFRPTLQTVPSFDQPVLGIGLSIPLGGKTSPLRQTYPTF